MDNLAATIDVPDARTFESPRPEDEPEIIPESRVRNPNVYTKLGEMGGPRGRLTSRRSLVRVQQRP